MRGESWVGVVWRGCTCFVGAALLGRGWLLENLTFHVLEGDEMVGMWESGTYKMYLPCALRNG